MDTAQSKPKLKSSPEERLAALMQSPVTLLKRVGPGRQRFLSKLNITTLNDLLTHYPKRHGIPTVLKNIAQSQAGEICCHQGEVVSTRLLKSRGYRNRCEIVLDDGSGQVTLVFWRRAKHFREQFKKGQWWQVTGKVELYQKRLQISHPELEKINPEQRPHVAEDIPKKPQPFYSLSEGLTQNIMRAVMGEALSLVKPHIKQEPLPSHILEHHALMPLKDAIIKVHFPDSIEEGQDALKRLAYEEFFLMECDLALSQSLRQNSPKPQPLVRKSQVDQRIRDLFPWNLTKGQQAAIDDILGDLAKPAPMHRLLQGDVGSGKTAVAIAALLHVIADGGQVAFMAPTEILAQQHFTVLNQWLPERRFEMALLVGSMTDRDKKITRQQLKAGEIQLVMGTHALAQDMVDFKNLRLVVIDEQHRFGVMQRARLQNKGAMVDTLIMTATPIPRTLCLTLYGDLDVSLIKHRPPGRQPINTQIVTQDRLADLHQNIKNDIDQGAQAYFVAPLIENSEKILSTTIEDIDRQLREGPLAAVPRAFLHGQMPAQERAEVMKAFKEGQLKILVATTVIEVGVDVPNASIMVIQGAERFGLSQLHQLRGRVGRGERASFCYLLSASPNPELQKRLRIMTKTQNGFRISEEDLKLRGGGDLFGTRQSGNIPLKAASPLDFEALQTSRDDAFAWLNDSTTAQERQIKIRSLTLSRLWHFQLGRSLIHVG